ncbi:MAG TPA: ABC transporter substrate binding protein [Candidatus Wallbacteria bacterium]|nr:ABC transporter substrate binding protein [Candidatus Wallbacteria bacterium]
MTKKFLTKSFLTISVSFILILAAIYSFAESSDRKSILILHSYHKSDWTDSLTSGIYSVFGEDKAEAKIEYMDTKWSDTVEYNQKLREILLLKYKNKKFDAIITSDDNALRFAVNNHGDIFHEAPISFCGANKFDPSLVVGSRKIGGVLEKCDFAESLALAKSLRPKADGILVICDSTETSLANLREFKEAMALNFPSMKYVTTMDLSIDALESAVRNTDKDSFIFFISFWMDARGTNIFTSELESIFDVSPAPVFGRSEWMVGRGMTGGKCVSGYNQGRAAAEIAMEMMTSGKESAGKILESPNIFLFDNFELIKHSIKRSSLPEGSKVINVPRSYYAENPRMLKLVIAVHTSLAMLLAILFFNIRRRKKMETDLAKTAAMLKGVLANSPAVIYRVDKNGIFTLSEGKGLEALGLKPGQVVGTSVFEFYKDFPEILDQMKRALGGESIRTVTSVGDVYFDNICSPDFDGAGNREGLIGVATDITLQTMARKERELILNELKRKNAELESIIFAASHDLRSPLVNILGFSQRLETYIASIQGGPAKFGAEYEKMAEEIINEKMPKAIHYISSSGKKMDSLISGFLKISHAGRAEMKPVSIDMNALMKKISDSVAFQLQQSGATLHVEKLPRCYGDESHINQVFTNLIDNALKYRDPSRKAVILVGGMTKGKESIYTVEDNGIGIKPGYIEKIWGIFHRLDPQGSVAGEGLGLALVKTIVEKHGGKVLAESEFGKGTKFFITIPTTKKAGVFYKEEI